MAAPSTPSRVLGVIAALAALPFAVLAGLGVSNNWAIYASFVTGTILLVGVVAMLLFPSILRLTGTSRVRMSIAGALCALATCLIFVSLFAFLGQLMGRGPWVSGFLLYGRFSLSTLSPILIAIGLIGGWIAGARKFAP
jgi:hypothetical protein